MTDPTVRDPALVAVVGGETQRLLELARRHLGMEVAFLAEFTEGKQVYRGLAGDAASFGFELQEGILLPESYCQLMTGGEVPNAIQDTAALPAVRDLAVTSDAGIGSYVGVPVQLSDGLLYGSLCTVSHAAHPVDDKDVRFLTFLAELLAWELQEERNQATARDRLNELIVDERIEIALQPIVDIRTGHLRGVEALSRFPGDYGPPDKVFETAHVVGLRSQLELLAARRAMELLSLLGPEAYLAINASPAVAIELAALAAGLDVPFDRLVLEITEHAAVENYAVLRDGLAGVRRRGLRLAIDDAGAGYASLHHIVELRPDIIKIDRSLIDGIAEDSARRSVVRAFVALASDLGAAVVGEGVEAPADLDSARHLGVDAVQGYLLAKPSTDRAELACWIDAPLWT
jgi:EAL domain-containing protein (putative c-di-GMP-specific phosphodiesterase class I)